MLIYKTVKVNSQKIAEKIKKYEETNNITGIKCPHCGGKEMIYHGSYERNVVEVETKRIETTIKIKRVKCKECKKTHSVIPEFLIPYKQHTLKLINKILKEKITEAKTKKEIEEETGISRQLQRKWEKELMELKGKLEILFLVFVFKELIEKINEEDQLIKKYLERYKEIYMLRRKGIIYGYAAT